MGSKITIIGAGSVGATIAYNLSQSEYTSEIVLIDINEQKAEGEVIDIVQGTCFRNPISIKAGGYEDAADSDIVIITSGIARKPGQTRLELVKTNVGIMKSIAPQIAKTAPNAKYIIVSNPVDIMTYAFIKVSGIPEKQVIGSGTSLDTARLRFGLSEELGIAQKNIHSYVFGEHGDTSFIPWSCTFVAGQQVDEYLEMKNKSIDKDAVLEYVKKSGGEIIAKKGATFYAVAIAVVKLVEVLLASSSSMVTVSTMMHGEYGLEDVCLSILTQVGPEGVDERIPVKLTEEELVKIRHSAEVLKDIIGQLEW